MSANRAILLLAFATLVAGCSGSEADSLSEIICWGGREQPSATPPEGLKVKQYSVGGSFACAIDADDKLVCWGKPDGADDLTYKYLSKAPVGAKAKHVHLNGLNGCIITENGLPFCWGADGLDRIGVEQKVTYKSIYTDSSIACAISDKSKVDCWGGSVDSVAWSKILLDKKVTEFKFNTDSVCWKTADEYGLRCTGWVSGDKDGYKLEAKGEVLDFGMQSLGNRFWYVDHNNTLNLVRDAQVIAQEGNVKSFARDYDTCILYQSGKLDCQPIKGGVSYPFGPAVNVPQDVRLTNIQVRQPMACGLKES